MRVPRETLDKPHRRKIVFRLGSLSKFTLEQFGPENLKPPQTSESGDSQARVWNRDGSRAFLKPAYYLGACLRNPHPKINPRGPPLRHRRHHAKFRLRSPFGTPADAKFLRIVPNSFGSATLIAKFSKIIVVGGFSTYFWAYRLFVIY